MLVFRGRSVILEREIFNFQNKNPLEGLLETSKKYHPPPQNRKTNKQTNKQNSNNKNKIALKTENRMQNHQNI